ncbi:MULTISPECIES: serine/threonine-protein kinase [unclassified Saccharopolyspora]|uniref:serine/threonine-protein kinase n=1 Tax=unclassified Saccharopolyspora TaxID=2646250 RepID=UPI001CD5E0FA|nr:MULTISPECIES: serine/threonine-protein kinase [unclassified Saccharopolyspora]MCA1186186.1 serine/threonine protein kinase [Saccharopolyspora sp. 6T]MCA1278389.1 serine/threonine protein kinase [Saccharopolyspora sp. 7B]
MQIGTVVAGCYRITGQLGRGGMGRLFRAEEIGTGHEVAVKTLLARWEESTTWFAERQGRLIVEGEFGIELRGIPGIPKVLDMADLTAEQGYVVFELVDGRSLDDFLLDHRPLKRRTAIAIAIQLGVVLTSVHHREAVHRDVKPSNVMVDHDGMVHLLDLGITRRLEDQPKPGGTAGYAPVEQIDGSLVDVRSDLYALGCVICEMITNEVPYGEDEGWNRSEEVHEPPEWISRYLGLELGELVAQMVTRDIDRRPGTATEVVQRLLTLLPPESAGPDPQAPDADPEAWLRRNPPKLEPAG